MTDFQLASRTRVVGYPDLDQWRMAHSDSIITIPWELLTKELESIPIEIKLHLTSIINVLQTSDKQLTSEKWISASITRVEACLDRTWEVLNSGYWKDVPLEYRYCYSLCIIIKAVLLELQYEINTKNCVGKEKKKTTILKNIIYEIDRGILLGAPLPSIPNLLTAIATKLNNYCAEINFILQILLEESHTINVEDISINHEETNYLMSNYPDRHFEKPSMQTFYNKIFMPKLPALLTDCINHWKALKLWKNPNYLNKIAGSRTVPIEIGSRYTEDDWTQHLINFSEFLQKHVIVHNSEVGYLAQHQLFEQIPELKEDFEVPEYCCFSDNEENDAESSEVDINAWFGPANTVSPLHFDPKNNLLSQIFGYKRVILYSPAETDNLYPYDSRLLNNTAQVDPVRPDYDKWPNFRKASGMTFYLKPGEMLYIPPKWWHHVTALTPSFSISFWWN
ncbi:bifunctional peptidase and arginyl-hydroxylase JMJD5 isoform X2 [Monomorium pharaonis]|uniref:bifunctional peptidase and arginyl-hydroxylase JMJD5 isoform X2 n=1 Tax=Monomorium pharaonis TaxID=307658 RepID=UPI001746364B|nr:bifunctional peptidase and arginyl-hydroxylase JMJD5 isoform X2 [Monomorium pharaonis]